MTCGRVVIISNGRVVAEDTPDNLMHRLKGAASLHLEVRAPAGAVFDLIRTVPGVLNIRQRDGSGDVAAYEIEAEAGRDLRAELARAVVQKGFDLLGLSQVGMSLEEIFLHLTTTDVAAEPSAAPIATTEVTA